MRNEPLSLWEDYAPLAPLPLGEGLGVRAISHRHAPTLVAPKVLCPHPALSQRERVLGLSGQSIRRTRATTPA